MESLPGYPSSPSFPKTRTSVSVGNSVPGRQVHRDEDTSGGLCKAGAVFQLEIPETDLEREDVIRVSVSGVQPGTGTVMSAELVEARLQAGGTQSLEVDPEVGPVAPVDRMEAAAREVRAHPPIVEG